MKTSVDNQAAIQDMVRCDIDIADAIVLVLWVLVSHSGSSTLSDRQGTAQQQDSPSLRKASVQIPLSPPTKQAASVH